MKATIYTITIKKVLDERLKSEEYLGTFFIITNNFNFNNFFS